MRRILFCFAILTAVASQARSWTGDEVKEVIKRVNTYWQTNNPAEVRAFWDNAAYHTGNMEVYKLLKDQKMLDYSIRWAEHNNWQGANEPDPAKWKYKQYGEGQDYVLFGDWQICSQTYIDLYNLSPDEKKIARAKEVMGFVANSNAHDYWWSASCSTKRRTSISATGNTSTRNTRPTAARRTSGHVVTDGCWPVWPRCYRICLRDQSISPSSYRNTLIWHVRWQRHNSPKDIGPARWQTLNRHPAQRLQVRLSSAMVCSGV